MTSNRPKIIHCINEAMRDFIIKNDRSPNVCYVSIQMLECISDVFKHNQMYILLDKKLIGMEAQADYIHGYTATHEELGFFIKTLSK